MEQILVIGGAGFIGTALVKQLVKEHEVWVLDNYSTGLHSNEVEGVQYVDGNAEDIFHFFVGYNFTKVFHLGEYSRVEQSFREPSKVFSSNMQIHAVLEYCRIHNAKLIYSGSSTKFSDEGKSLCPYAWTKATNTNLVNQYNEWYDINYAIVYFYNVYGPGELSHGNYATLIGKLIDGYANGRKPKVTLPGTQKRNFTHIDDTIRGILLVADQGHGDNFGIGCDDEYSVLDIALRFSKEIEYQEAVRGNRDSAPVINNKLKTLGWRAENNVLDYIDTVKAELDG